MLQRSVGTVVPKRCVMMACRRDARPGGMWDFHELYRTVEMKQSSDSPAGHVHVRFGRGRKKRASERV